MPTYTRSANTHGIVKDTNNVVQVVEPGYSIATYKILGAGWTKTSDAPYFELATFRQTVTSPTTVSGLLAQRIIRVLAGAEGISMTANVGANPNIYPLTKGVAIDIVNDEEIDALVFTGAGAVTVIGLPE